MDFLKKCRAPKINWQQKVNTMHYSCCVRWPGGSSVWRKRAQRCTGCLSAELPQPSISSLSHACHNYFHSRIGACRNRLYISRLQERHCMNFLWSVTCQIGLGCLKHATLKFSPLPLCLLIRTVYSHTIMESNLVRYTWLAWRNQTAIFWLKFVIISAYFAYPCHVPLTWFCVKNVCVWSERSGLYAF